MREMSPEERENYDRLVGNVKQELRAQNTLRGLDLPIDVIDDLAEDIASQIECAFEIRWRPRWEARTRSDPN